MKDYVLKPSPNGKFEAKRCYIPTSQFSKEASDDLYAFHGIEPGTQHLCLFDKELSDDKAQIFSSRTASKNSSGSMTGIYQSLTSMTLKRTSIYERSSTVSL